MISIIIPTYNRPDTLMRVLPSYFLQKEVQEIILIDDASERDYAELITFGQKEADKNNIKFIYYKNKINMGAAACRNIGLVKASGDFILWGEDDAFLREDYTSVLLKKIKNKEILFGNIYYGITPDMNEEQKYIIIKEHEQRKRKTFDFKVFEGYYGKRNTEDIEVPYGHALILLPATAYDECKYFEGYKGNGYREESDAQVQLSIKGYKIIFTSDTCCYHLPHIQTETKSGQHTMSKYSYEMAKIKNTFIFYNRFYPFFKEKYQIPSKQYLQYYFVKKELETIGRKLIKKIRRCFNAIFI